MSRNINVVVSVVDQTKKPLENLNRNIKRTGIAANTTNLSFKDFNRTLFATTAFVATFGAAFYKLKNIIQEGAEFDRLIHVYEKTFGSRGNLISHIANFTDAAVDETQVMQSAMDLHVAGVSKNSEELAKLFAMAAAAARRSGKDTSDGVKRISEFLKSGSVQALQYLGVIRNTDERFTSLIEVMKQAGGALGGTISMQAKLAFAMEKLKEFTKGYMFGLRNLGDVIVAINSSFGIFSKSMSNFIAKSLAPLIDKVTSILNLSTIWFETLVKGNKDLMFLTRSIIVATSALSGLILTLGALKLSTMLLGSIGIGIPFLTTTLVTLGVVFSSVTQEAESLIDKFKLFGSFARGVWQLITSFDEDTGFSKIDEDLKNLLEKNKIFEFTKDVSRAMILVKAAFEGFFIGVKTVIDKVSGILEKFGISVKNFFGTDAKTWSKDWIHGVKAVASAVGVLVAALAPLALFSLGKGILSKIPVIGRLFGGGTGIGPKGTLGDPMYVRDTGGGGIGGPLTNYGVMHGTGISRYLTSIYRLFRMKVFSPIAAFLKGEFSVLVQGLSILVGPKIINAITTLIKTIGKFGTSLIKLIPKFATFAGLLATLGVAAHFATTKLMDKFAPKGWDTALGDLAFDLKEKITTAMQGKKSDMMIGRQVSEKLPSKLDYGIGVPDSGVTIRDGDLIEASNEARIKEIENMLHAFSDRGNDAFMDALIDAVKSRQDPTSPGGARITREEFQEFKKVYREAMNESNIMKNNQNNGRSKRINIE